MTYSGIVTLFLIASIALDRYGTRVRLFTRRAFWTSYAIILPFQLLTNWWLTSRNIVKYRSGAIIGWRIASAPVEDLLFGFALILGVLTLWVKLGRRR
jgi:lycopene cyclase domain-containing protein